MKKILKAKFLTKYAVLIFSLGIFAFLSVSPKSQAQTITQGYSSDSIIQRSTIVSLKLDEPKHVEPASFDNFSRLHGVVVSPNDAPFTLSSEGERVFVATTGRFEMYVSTESGAIQAGDLIAVSRVAGIGMKAGERDPFVVGKAITDFSGESAVLSTTTVNDGGIDRSVSIGRVKVDIGVAGNPLLKPTQANLPGFLEKLAENIAQKPVSPIRIYIGMGIFFTAAVVSGTLLYSGIRSGMISVGRNPLSKKSITRSLMQVVLTSLIILLLGVFAVYLLLRI